MRRALVTGGSGALGAAICRRLGSAGRHVYVHANASTARAEAVVADILAAGGSAATSVFDVTDPSATEAGLGRVLGDGPIEILVNNAGVHDDAVMPAMRLEQWTRVI